MLEAHRDLVLKCARRFEMFRLGPMAVTAALLLSVDVSGTVHLQPPLNGRFEFPASENLPVLPGPPQDKQSANDQDHPTQLTTPDTKSGKITKDEPLQPESRLSLIRFVDGELVRVVEPLPAGKKGFHLKAGVPLDEKELRTALGSAGSAINPGDKAQISSLQFKDREIIVDINGGGRGKTRLRDRIHMEVGGVPTVTSTGQETPVNTNAGATIYLDFDKPLPDMTPDDLKQYLSSLLDFSQQHSAAVQWMTTLPPDIQNAIGRQSGRGRYGP